MIRVKLYTNFYDRIYGGYAGEQTEPSFRDEESIRLLCETRNIELDEDDLKYVLTLLDYSRRGKYLPFRNIDKICWKVLSEMPFDILVARNIDEMGIRSYHIEEASYVIENYPYKNKELQVNVIGLDSWFDNKDFYTRLNESDGCGTDYELWLGKDGKYYAKGERIGYAFQYYWKNDVPGIIHFCEEYETAEYLVQVNQECNVFELGALLKLSYDEYDETFFSKYLSDLNMYKNMLENSDITKDVFNEMVEELKGRQEYQQYLFYLNNFKVVHHFIKTPQAVTSRKLPILMADRYDDGTYAIRGELTVKYPEFYYMVLAMLEQRHEHRITFGLFVDVDELLDNVEDMKHTLHGFCVTYDSLEMFDKEEAIKKFGAFLKEAYESGKCMVSKEFY